jgi:hypothetical protein
MRLHENSLKKNQLKQPLLKDNFGPMNMSGGSTFQYALMKLLWISSITPLIIFGNSVAFIKAMCTKYQSNLSHFSGKVELINPVYTKLKVIKNRE